MNRISKENYYLDIAETVLERATCLRRIYGAIIVKMWLHITKEEQMSRFEKRAEDPLKHWKITDEDWRNRKRWKDYIAAAEDMFAGTSPDFAPWQVIPANFKWYARVKVLRTVCDRVGSALGVKPPAG